jgi:hypothetical protein
MDRLRFYLRRTRYGCRKRVSVHGSMFNSSASSQTAVGSVLHPD